jgi:ankyrin repeat protein
VKLLLGAGANFTLKDRVRKRSCSMANPHLIKLRGDIVQHGYTALEHAANCGRPKIMNLLIAAGADVHAPNEVRLQRMAAITWPTYRIPLFADL